ncbi:uncharacterized protein [Epargyreus clarus]|uniref:uncharacterized protein n=1 Tax=Epargyreus clarus TaxID=520877 RepID=UPI003C300FFA
MKPLEERQENPVEAQVTGDVIGDTAYSERFVLKILLKLANLDLLKEEVQEKTFEDDLCTLWDMTAERDVVLFLQKHEILKLLNFALPTIETPRIIEIVVGIIANMCCQKEAVESLLKMDSFLSFIIEYIKSDDSLVIIQLLRLVNSCLFLASEDDVGVWTDLFIKVGYSSALYFILKNSSNKDLLVTALENFNTICSYCNTDKTRINFFGHFVTVEALESLTVAFSEVTIKQKELVDKNELERVLIISLQITLNLVGFDKKLDISNENMEDVALMVKTVLHYYERKIVNQKEVDMDLVDIVDSTVTIVKVLEMSEISEPDKYFTPSYNMWKALNTMEDQNKNDSSKFEEDDKDELQEFSCKLRKPLCTLICLYLQKCSDENLSYSIEQIDSNLDEVLISVVEAELVTAITDRLSYYRTRIKDC